ncbi:unnamed protein product [Scytosiphon promiscuus]
MLSQRPGIRQHCCASIYLKTLLTLSLCARGLLGWRAPLTRFPQKTTLSRVGAASMSYRGRGRGRGGGGGGGRGEYYKNKYGGGGRGGRGRGDGGGDASSGTGVDFMVSRSAKRSGDAQQLIDSLRRMENRPYPSYKDIEGSWMFSGQRGMPDFVLGVDKIQADPFAAPSRFHVVVPGAVAGFPAEAFSTKVRKVALCDFLTRRFLEAARQDGADQKAGGGGWGGAKGGEITIDEPGQHILERSSVLLHERDGSVEARFTVGMPARGGTGRSICGGWAVEILGKTVPELIRRSLLFSSLDGEALRQHVLSAEDQEVLRGSLRKAGVVGFVINGAILPRESGNSDKPMDASQAIPFTSPPSLEKTFTLPNRGQVTGMGIPPGVTLIVGGGFHGKSTIEVALQVGCYNHIPGDGREFVSVEATAVKVRAEDGRCVNCVDITPFIDNLPFGKSTNQFTTPDASGSTSQATNIIEALEAGCTTLLVDEDTCATNFMIRDLRMQMLVAKEKEPITPFISRVRALYETMKVSSILVIGGCGDYFEVADTVIMMDCYVPKDVTADAKRIAADHTAGGAGGVKRHKTFCDLSGAARVPVDRTYVSRGKVVARSKEKIQFGDFDIDLAGVEQLVEISQTRAVADTLDMLARSGMTKKLPMAELLDFLEAEIDAKGLDAIMPGAFMAKYARPRRFEVAAAINRFREGKIEQVQKPS